MKKENKKENDLEKRKDHAILYGKKVNKILGKIF